MASLEGEIASIDTILAQIAQRRVFVRRRINGLSPTARIPSEILIEIFQIACQPVDKGYRVRRAVTPLFIGSICRLWRDVAWSTPLLWNTILLHVSPDRKHHDTQVQLLGDWLLNARSAPLSIKLIVEDERESVLCAFEAIMRILITRSDYWLTFDSRLPPQCHNIFKNINFPMLTSVSLQLSNTVSTSIIPDMFLTAPKLVDVNLLNCHFPLMLPWEQVRRFRTGLSSITECLKVLRESPNLQECYFNGVYTPVDFISKTIIPHAQLQLKHLHVMLQRHGPWTLSDSMSLFDGMTLPSLSNLCIQYYGTTILHLSSITSLVLRSACNLERFTIKFPFDNAELIPCLEAMPSLTYLDLEMPRGLDMGLTRHNVTSLDPLSNSSRLLLPNLKYLKYKGPVLCDCRTIVDMLAHRWHLSDDSRTSQGFTRVSKLQLAEILSTVPYLISADVQEELKNLLEEGMSVRIESLVRTPATFNS